MVKDIISFRGDWSLHESTKKDIKFTNKIDVYEIKFVFDGEEYIFILPEDTLLDVKESDTKFDSKRVSKISEGDEILISFYSLYRKTAPVFNTGYYPGRQIIREARSIKLEKHIVKISSVSFIKENVAASFPVETIYKFLTNKSEPNFPQIHPKLRPIIPINSICEEWIDK